MIGAAWRGGIGIHIRGGHIEASGVERVDGLVDGRRDAFAALQERYMEGRKRWDTDTRPETTRTPARKR